MHVQSRQADGHASPWGHRVKAQGSPVSLRQVGVKRSRSIQLKVDYSEGSCVAFKEGQGMSDGDEAGGQ